MPRDIKIAREATMMDIFPTILSFSGLAGRDAKAGLGRSLLGEAPTLLETKGFAQFTAELFPNPALSQAVWGNRAP